MKSFLRTETVEDIVGLPPILIRQISVAQANELTAYQRENDGKADALAHVPAMVCKMCVEEWKGEAIEDIEASITWDDLAALSRRIYVLSGMKIDGEPVEPSKNSEPAPSASSSTG